MADRPRGFALPKHALAPLVIAACGLAGCPKSIERSIRFEPSRVDVEISFTDEEGRDWRASESALDSRWSRPERLSVEAPGRCDLRPDYLVPRFTPWGLRSATLAEGDLSWPTYLEGRHLDCGQEVRERDLVTISRV